MLRQTSALRTPVPIFFFELCFGWGGPLGGSPVSGSTHMCLSWGPNVEILEIFGSRFEISEWIREFFGLVRFIGDSGGNIFFGDRFEFFWNRLEIVECGVKFVGQVSFIGDYGENIFFVAVLKLLEIVWIMDQLFTQKCLVFF